MTNHRDQREALFAALSDGTIAPEEAEAKAQELGLEPLTPKLDPARYDPMRQTHWTLAMVLAWIIWRAADAVRDLMPEWRRDLYTWNRREHVIGDGMGGHEVRAGWLYEQVHQGAAPMMSLCVLGEVDASRPDASARVSVRDAHLDLWEKLGAGTIQASTAHHGVPHLIDAHEWPFLVLIEFRERDILRAGRDMFATALTYDANDVWLRRDDVLRVWPVNAPTDAPAAAAPSLHDVIRSIADAVLKPGMRAGARNDAIREEMKRRGLTPASPSTIKKALRGTRHLRSRAASGRA